MTPPELIPEVGKPPVLTSPNPFSTLHRRFACARLPQPCLPGSCLGARWLEISPSFITRTVGRCQYADDASVSHGRVDDWRGSRWQWGVAVVRSRPVPQSTPELRFQSPLVAPDVQISRIRRSDKTSRLHPRHVVPKPAQAYEPKVPVKMREWIGPALASPDLVLEAQPPA